LFVEKSRGIFFHNQTMAFAFRGTRMLMREIPKSAQTGLVKFSISNTNPSVQLFRDMIRELPKLFTIYDISVPLPVVRERERAQSKI
jgi:hypothetical protein